MAGLLDRAAYNDYKRRLDGRALLEHYGAQNCTEQPGADGTTEIVHSCLLDRVEPHHTNGDANPSACLNIDKGVYVCYALGWGGDLMHLVAKLEDKDSLSAALPTISEMLTGATADTETFSDELDRLFSTPVYDIDLPSYSTRVLDPWLYCHPYMTDERGIPEEIQALLKIGYDMEENRIVFPHFVQGRLVGWQKRVIPERPGWPGTTVQQPKYRNSSGFPKAETLYNYDIASRHRHVIVVESPMSVAKAHSLAIPGVVATFGAKVTDHQAELLRSFERVIVWFDADPAGFAGQHRLVEALHRHTDVLVVDPDERDLGDYTDPGELHSTLASARPAALVLAEYDMQRRYGRRKR